MKKTTALLLSLFSTSIYAISAADLMNIDSHQQQEIQNTREEQEKILKERQEAQRQAEQAMKTEAQSEITGAATNILPKSLDEPIKIDIANEQFTMPQISAAPQFNSEQELRNYIQQQEALIKRQKPLPPAQIEAAQQEKSLKVQAAIRATLQNSIDPFPQLNEK